MFEMFRFFYRPARDLSPWLIEDSRLKPTAKFEDLGSGS
jgi:hypothetical protein